MRFLFLLSVLVLFYTTTAQSQPSNKVVIASEVQWTPLNPARGDQSPQTGTLWGDRGAEVATGFLVKFTGGFSSPPHIHNVTYRGVVIHGNIHNDDPEAEAMWMPTGSFWTQPAGESHITAAQGSLNMAIIEIEDGPYLVRPTEQAFDNGERPLNVHVSNLVWTKPSANTNAMSQVEIAYLWGDHQNKGARGLMIKIPKGFKGKINPKGSQFRAILIKGEIQYEEATADKYKKLDPGSYMSGTLPHFIKSESGESILYVSTNGKTTFSLDK